MGCLTRGWLPTVLRESLGNAAFFAAYHYTKNAVTRWEWGCKQERCRKQTALVSSLQGSSAKDKDKESSNNSKGNNKDKCVISTAPPVGMKDSTAAILLAGKRVAPH